MDYVSEQIVPAIMPRDFDDLREQMKRFIGLVPMVQIDVMDGRLSDSKSWPYKNGTDSEFIKIVGQEEGFPFWEDIDFEADLMVGDPARMADQWIAAGAARIVVHYESAAPAAISDVLKSIKEKGIEAGLAVGLETSTETLKKFYEDNKDHIDAVQFMGIEKIGFQGQPFSEKVIDHIRDFLTVHPQAAIAVDGGVNLDTVKSLAEAKVSRFVIGSALQNGEQNGESIAQTIEQFDQFLNIS